MRLACFEMVGVEAAPLLNGVHLLRDLLRLHIDICRSEYNSPLSCGEHTADGTQCGQSILWCALDMC